MPLEFLKRIIMQINRKKILILLCLVGAFIFYKTREIRHSSGVLIPENPIQTEIAEDSRRIHIIRKDIIAEPLARYRIKARVLSTNRYWLDPGAVVSPIDLALGWGIMSDSQVLEELSISQSLRFYYIRWQKPISIPTEEIMRHSANVHVIPANEVVQEALFNLRKGHLIEMSGDLVVVSAKGRPEWRTSLTRDDTGAGACELMYVESLKILNPKD